MADFLCLCIHHSVLDDVVETFNTGIIPYSLTNNPLYSIKWILPDEFQFIHQDILRRAIKAKKVSRQQIDEIDEIDDISLVVDSDNIIFESGKDLTRFIYNEFTGFYILIAPTIQEIALNSGHIYD